jgi:hypothetical protein
MAITRKTLDERIMNDGLDSNARKDQETAHFRLDVPAVSCWTGKLKQRGPHSSNSGSSSMNSPLQKGSSGRKSAEVFVSSDTESDLSSHEHYADMIHPPPPVDIGVDKS